jgi:hypothetical protein
MRRAAIVLAALLAALPAWAQPAPATGPGAPPGTTEESRHAARALGAVIGIDAQVRDALAAIHLDLLRRTMQRGGQGLDVAAPVVDQVLMPGFTARRDELTAVLLEPWASNFTPSELRLLHSFFASPLGQRYLRLQPTIAQQAAQGSEKWSQRVFSDIVENQTDELRARGLRF